MKTIKNLTRQPLRVPLPRGKFLHLGPGHEGQVNPSALERPALQKLVEAGKVEVVGDGEQPGGSPGDAPRSHGSTQGPAPKVAGRKGDR
jgi:hypothetical protein